MKAVLESFAQETTCHGWKNIADKTSSIYSRLLWAVVVFCMIVGLGYSVISTYIAYTKHSILTVTKTEKRNKLNFPAVTICNKGRYDNSSGQISTAEANFLLRYSDYYDPEIYDVNISKPAFNSSMRDFQLKTSFNWTQMIGFVKFRFRAMNISDPDLFEFRETGMGQCMTIHGPRYFKKKGNPIVQGEESKRGLQLLLNSLQDDYILFDEADAGFEVFIHEPHTPAPYLSGGIPVSPGFNTYISLKPTEYKLLPKPYRSYGGAFCEETSPDYSHSACVFDCIGNMTVNECGCKTLKEAGTHPSLKDCTFQETYGCYQRQTIYNYVQAETGKICNCPRPCRIIKYDAVISQALYPSKATHRYITDVLHMNATLEDLRNNLVGLRIFFQDLTYNEVEHVPEFNLKDIFGSVGGQMGFFLCASMISVTEFLLAIVKLLTNGLQFVTNQQSNNKKVKPFIGK